MLRCAALSCVDAVSPGSPLCWRSFALGLVILKEIVTHIGVGQILVGCVRRMWTLVVGMPHVQPVQTIMPPAEPLLLALGPRLGAFEVEYALAMILPCHVAAHSLPIPDDSGAEGI